MSLEGQILGDYRVLHELGRGGMGIVYLAEQLSLGRRVALKVLPKASALSNDMVTRFRREAEAASRLDHPAICAIYATGVHEGIPWIAMRFVEGRPLVQLIRDRRKPTSADAKPEESQTFCFDFNASTGSTRDLADPETLSIPSESESETTTSSREDINWAVKLVETAARALHRAHEARIIHRDIKPGNIMVTPDGLPVLLDFGLARQMERVDGASLTQSGDVMGTPHYMSPEQLNGHRTIDARTDVYSLGVTLYELVTGRRPFEAPNREQLYRAILHDDPISVSKRNPLVERDLEIVIETAIDRDLDRRYQSASAFADDLRAVLNHEPIAARALGPFLRFRKWARRKPRTAVGIVAAFIILTAGIIEGRIYALRLEEERDATREEAKRAEKAKRDLGVSVERLTVELKRSRALRLAAEAQSLAANEPALALHLALEAGNLERRPEIDRALRLALASGPEEHLFEAPNLIDTSDASLAETSKTQPAEPQSLSSTAKRERPRSLRRGFRPDEILRSLSARDRLRDTFAVAGDVHFGSAKIATLDSVGEGVPVIWDLETGRLISILGGHGGRVFTVRFSPDGTRAVTAGDDGTVRVFDVETGHEERRLQLAQRTQILGRTIEFESAKFDPQGELIVAVASGAFVVVWGPEGQRPLARQSSYRVSDGPPLAIIHPSFSWVASAATNRVLVWMPGAENRPIELANPGSDAAISSLAFSPVGTRVAVGDATGRISIWDVPLPPWSPGLAPAPILTFVPHQDDVRSLSFSPGGRYLATGGKDGHLFVFDLGNPTERPKEALRHMGPEDHGGTVLSIQWASDQSRVLTTSTDRAARVFDVQNGVLSQELRGHSDWVVSGALSEDGARLVTFSIDGTARVFRTNMGQIDPSIPEPLREIASVEWSPDGRRVLTACRDGKVFLIEPERSLAPREILPGNDYTFRTARYLPGNTHRCVLLGTADLWIGDITSPIEPDVITKARGVRDSVTILPSRMSIAALSDDRVVYIDPEGTPVVHDIKKKKKSVLPKWKGRRHVLKKRPLHAEFLLWVDGQPPALINDQEIEDGRVLTGINGPPGQAEFSPDGRHLVFRTQEGESMVLDLLNQQVHGLGRLNTLPVFTNDSSDLIVAPIEDAVSVMDVATLEVKKRLPIMGLTTSRLMLSRTGRSLIALSGAEVMVYDLESSTLLAAHRAGSAALADWDLSPAGPERLAMGFTDGRLSILDLEPEARARAWPLRSLTAREMERHELGSEESRHQCRRNELSTARRIQIEGLFARVQSDPSASQIATFCRRVFDPKDPVPERFAGALADAEQIVSRSRRPSAEALYALALAESHTKPEDLAIARAESALTAPGCDDLLREEINHLIEELRSRLSTASASTSETKRGE